MKAATGLPLRGSRSSSSGEAEMGGWGLTRGVWVSLTLAVVCLTSVGAPAAAASTDLGDVRALNALKRAWGGGTSLWAGADPCENGWEGVMCKDGRVTSLYLVSRELSGTIPSEIGLLTGLQNLDISFNPYLKGYLPKELGDLKSLLYLSLQKCHFSGPIPDELGNLVNLTFFAINNNRLDGPVPSSLGALKHLKWFDVAYNRLSGLLPVSTSSPDGLGFDSWPDIEHYHLNDNKFEGPIPPELGNAHKCVHMLLENNRFTGPIPESFGNLSALQILNLHYNQLTGPIPATLNKILKNVTASHVGLLQIRVAHNMLTGTLPVLDALSQLEYVDFSNNAFEPQPFPSWLNASSKNIQTIRFDNGSLTGPLPTDILSYPALQGLYLESNKLNESLSIPAELGQKLRIVALQNNMITSLFQPAPNAVLQAQILLQGNPICTDTVGLLKVNPALCNTTETPMVMQWTSPLVGENCPRCEKPSLTSNPSQCRCSRPLVVILEVRAPTFTNIDNVTLWDSLKEQTVGSLQNLTVKDEPPWEFNGDQLWVRDASFNDTLLRVEVSLYFFPLVGETMDRKHEDFLTRSFTLQKVKYQSPFKPELVKEIIPSSADLQVVSGGLSKTAIIGIAVGAGVSLVLVGFLVFLACRLKGRVKQERDKNPFAAWKNAEEGAAPKLKGASWFSFDDIKRMTNNFNEDNVLGVGGYGKVYKGIQAGTGTTVAVKRAQEGSKQGAHEFKNEIELLSRVHHNNLVGLVGFCYEKAEQMLVYEYMPNGSLTDWLRGPKSASQPLEWDRRLLIALGAARGLAYLHNNADPPIIHRDVKSCNILLDKKMNSKVADFGLSTLVPDEKNGKLKMTIKGTMGYLDPEYYNTSEMSPKSDVYSFGVVLLELLTGKPPILRGGHIVREVRTKVDISGLDGMKELLDPALADTLEEELETFMNIALVCVEDTSLERPSMHEVVKQLELLVGPKAQLMTGGEKSMESKMSRRERRTTPRQVHASSNSNPNPPSDDLEPPSSGQYSQGSTSSQQSSFKYSGGFTYPVLPK